LAGNQLYFEELVKIMMKSDIKKLKCMNRFVFIIPFRNVKDYIDEPNSLINQKNKNWLQYFVMMHLLMEVLIVYK
jgi:hypothetical protein